MEPREDIDLPGNWQVWAGAHGRGATDVCEGKIFFLGLEDMGSSIIVIP